MTNPAPWLSWWPWLLVAALSGIGLALLLRQRRRAATAGGVEEIAFTPPEPPQPQPQPRAEPRPQPRAAPPAADKPLPAGLVTTRLRSPAARPMVERVPAEAAIAPAPAPTGAIVSKRLRGWIDLDLAMREILFVENEAHIRFDVTVANGGAAPARQIVVEALALNAGDTQAEEIGRFFDRPAASEAGLAELGPLGSITLSHEIRMPRSAIRAYEVQGRTLFVPVVAFNASYRTGSGEGRTSAAFLVGREVPGSDRLAPLKLETGAARLLGLGVRRLEEAVRR